MTDLETTTASPSAPGRVRAVAAWFGGGGPGRLVRGHGILLALAILIVVGAVLSPNFRTAANLANVSRQGSIVGILGIGMTFVILTAGIDLSVGSILGLVAISFAGALAADVPWPAAIALALLVGGGAGALNGLGITKGGLQPFIMTLGMLVIARGACSRRGTPPPISSTVRWRSPARTSRSSPSGRTARRAGASTGPWSGCVPAEAARGWSVARNRRPSRATRARARTRSGCPSRSRPSSSRRSSCSPGSCSPSRWRGRAAATPTARRA